MIKATFNKENDRYTRYQITGHANYADLGKDIVCAAVSALYTAITNKLICCSAVTINDNEVLINVENEVCDTLVDTLYTALSDIQMHYPDNVSVDIEEKKTAKVRYAVHGYSKVFGSEEEAVSFAESVSVPDNQVLTIYPPGLAQSSFDKVN
ncbi:ribosomal-processing cysteine protease Prp [Enterococcus sp. AZ109]|uniref:ribosomal-processing cysteine protease Prp n=1 Tax=Enterococcus sp. AZ109 TaxID=2774634 RepID=UPI003F29A89C